MPSPSQTPCHAASIPTKKTKGGRTSGLWSASPWRHSSSESCGTSGILFPISFRRQHTLTSLNSSSASTTQARWPRKKLPSLSRSLFCWRYSASSNSDLPYRSGGASLASCCTILTGTTCLAWSTSKRRSPSPSISKRVNTSCRASPSTSRRRLPVASTPCASVCGLSPRLQPTSSGSSSPSLTVSPRSAPRQTLRICQKSSTAKSGCFSSTTTRNPTSKTSFSPFALLAASAS
mmetsp:Transcript_15224/g.38735  ORF Transcript_15224/g.38735 Transcript_15224/m.38735 type:complete len:234 (+) Transcript_15224:996-1697(+)